MLSYFELNFIEKFLWVSVFFFFFFFFQILAKIEMTRNKNRLCGRYFERLQHFILFYFILFYFILFYFILFYFSELWIFIVRTYMVQIALQNSGRKVVFLGGSMEPPWAASAVKVP